MQYSLFNFDKKFFDSTSSFTAYSYPSSLKELIRQCDINNPITMKDFYSESFAFYERNNPLLAFDYLLEGISIGALDENRENSQKVLFSLLRHSCSTNSSETTRDLTWEKIFKPDFWQSKSDKRKAGYLLLRILAVKCDSLIICDNAHFRVVDFLYSTLNDIANRLQINNKDQTFTQLSKWRDFDKPLFDAWVSIDKDITTHGEKERKELNQFFARLRKDYIYFVNFEEANSFPEDLYTIKSSFIHYLGDENLQAAKAEVDKVEKMFNVVLERNSLYVAHFVIPILQKFLIFLAEKIKESDKPSNLSIMAIERLYAFFDQNAEIILRIRLINDGGGFATNVNLNITFEESIEVNNNSTFSSYWPQLAPGLILISIPIKTKNPFTGNLFSIYEITWTNWENKTCSCDGYIEFNCEKKKNINWDKFGKENRYNLKAITKDEDFAGKEGRIDPIVNDIEVNLQPSWLTGQKRTGKTSILYGVKRALERLNEFIIANTSYGRFSHAEPKTLIDQLVTVLIEQFIKTGELKINIPSPNGSLVPLVKFIEDVHYMTGKKLYFMIDEFDELPIDFYKPNPISNSFWQSMRTISQLEYAGFLLVGGENIEYLKTAWGQDININTTHHSDIFKENEYDDFKSLIQTPTINELDFQADAIQTIYFITGGNPFFAKLLCRVIQKHACQKHNTFISSIEVEDAAIDLISGDLQMDHFQHFIKDGIKMDSSNAEKHLLLRAKFLYLISLSLMGKSQISQYELRKRSIEHGITDEDFNNILTEYRSRKIIKAVENRIEFQIPLFGNFLRSRGNIEVQRFFKGDEELESRLVQEEFLRIKVPEVQELSTKWEIYQDDIIKPEYIIRFIEQFDGVQLQRKVFEFLKKIRFITYKDLMVPLTDAHKHAIRNARWEKAKGTSVRHDIFVSYLDGVGKSGAWIARKYLEINQISKENILELSKVQGIQNSSSQQYEHMRVLIFVDDFAGTGNTLYELILKNRTTLEYLTKVKNIKIIVFVAFCLEEGREFLLKKIDELKLDIDFLSGYIMREEEKIFSKKSRYFDDETEKEYLKAVFTNYGSRLVKNFPLGYNDSQVAIIFPVNCPNNSLPILWESNPSWVPLFRRRKNY